MHKTSITVITFLVLLALIVISLVMGCSNNANPIDPGADYRLTTSPDINTGNNRLLWGLWSVKFDPSSGGFDFVPLREAMLNVNVVGFLQPPSSASQLLTYSINPTSDFASGYIDLNVIIRHPFTGVNKFRGFDARGIVMADGSEPFAMDSSALRAGPDEMQLLNADGWTRWWNPTEFTTYGKIFGFTAGALAPGSYYPTAIINPYKYFADDIDKDASLGELDIATRGTFSTLPGINTRRYILQFPVPGGTPDFRFNYAVDASWKNPDNSYAPEYPIEAFPPDANQQEAWLVKVDDSGTTAWYVDETSNGGHLGISVEVYDWQGLILPGTVADEVAAIWVESQILPAPVDILPLTTPMPGSPGSSVWDVEINDLNLTGSGDFDIWIAVQSSHPTNYAPQFAGGDQFDWPDVPLRAYMKSSVNVSDTPGIEPEVIQVVPPSGVVSTVESDLQVMGNNFLSGASLEFRYDPTTTLDVMNVNWVDANLITCDVDCTGPLGFYDVTVTNPDMQQGTLEDGFEVIEFFECSGYAHDWTGNIFDLEGAEHSDSWTFDTAVIKQGPYAGLALFQTNYSTWSLFDPEAGPGQTVQPFITTPGMLIMDVETCETTGRITFLSQFNPRIIYIYDEEGNELGQFSDPNLDPTVGYFTCMDYDKFGDMWVVTKTGGDPETAIYEIRHYSMIAEEPFYEPVVDDTVDITSIAMTGPVTGYGIGDIGISFYLHRLFVFSSNTSDGGTTRVTSWDLNSTPPQLLAELQDPYPPFTRHNIFGGTGALSRQEIDVDHRFPNDRWEQCRIWLFASVYTGDLEHWIIRIDGDLNILDEGEKYVVDFPVDFHRVPQGVTINDWGPLANAHIIGVDQSSMTYVDWPVPSNW